MKRLYKLPVLVSALLWLAFATLRAEVAVPVATDLQRLGNEALSRELPILLSFTATFCSYCEMLEQDFLQPMLLGGDYRDKVIIRKLIVDYGSTVTDFNGRSASGRELSDRYRVFVTPTILFVDGHGNEIAERMIGINTPELFGGYLDDCIETALLISRDPGAATDATECRLMNPANSTSIFRTAKP